MSETQPSPHTPSTPGQPASSKLTKEQFSTKMKDILTKIHKTVPSRKNKELIEVCKQAIGKCGAPLMFSCRISRQGH